MGLRTVASKMSSLRKPGMVYFSDMIVLRQKLPFGMMAAAIASKYGYDLDPKTLSNRWKKVTSEKENFQKLYNTQLYQQQGFDPEKHYSDWVKSNISHTLGAFKHLQANPSPAEFRNLCRKIYLKQMNPFSYYISESFQHLAHKLNENNIPWGIIANQGPNFPSILDELNGRLPQPIYPIHNTNANYSKRKSNNKTPLIINASDNGCSKPGKLIFKRAVENSPARKNTFFVGVHPIIDQIRGSISPPLRTILLTETMDQPVSDIEHLQPAGINKLQNFRVKTMAELYRILIPGVNEHDIPASISFKDESLSQWSRESETTGDDLYQMLLPEALSQDEHVQENYHLMHFYDEKDTN